LSEPQVADIKMRIFAAYNEHRPWTMTQIRRHLNEDLGVNMSANTLAHIFARGPDVKTCTGVPMDVPIQAIQ
jgi:hypothetical protein